MDSEDFSNWGKVMVDFICDYFQNIDKFPVIPKVEPGYLRHLLPEKPPEDPENWSEIFADIQRFIIPGLTHWQHPGFHAYFPSASSTPSVLADMLSTALGCVGFSWAASPALTELEIIMMDWMAKLFSLPEEFTHASGKGGGVLQSSASDCILVSMLAARHHAIEVHKHKFMNERSPESATLSRLVAYASSLAHSCVEKASMISFVQFHQVAADEDYILQGDSLQAAIEEDLEHGLIPFYVCATLGTTACGSFDNLASVGPVCEKYGLWFHVDGAYGGNALICPEFKYLLNGIEYVWSMNVNPNKWLLVSYDCSLMWVRDRERLTKSMVVNPVYLQYKNSNKAIDFRHIKMARLFTQKVLSDDRFELIGKPLTGLVCFRLKGSNGLNQCLIRAVNETMLIHMVPAVANEIYFLRFTVCNKNPTEDDIEHAWSVISAVAGELLNSAEVFKLWLRYLNEIRWQSISIATTPQKNQQSQTSGSELWNGSFQSSCKDDQLMDRAEECLRCLQKMNANDAYGLLSKLTNSLNWDCSQIEDNSFNSEVSKRDSKEERQEEYARRMTDSCEMFEETKYLPLYQAIPPQMPASPIKVIANRWSGLRRLSNLEFSRKSSFEFSNGVISPEGTTVNLDLAEVANAEPIDSLHLELNSATYPNGSHPPTQSPLENISPSFVSINHKDCSTDPNSEMNSTQISSNIQNILQQSHEIDRRDFANIHDIERIGRFCNFLRNSVRLEEAQKVTTLKLKRRTLATMLSQFSLFENRQTSKCPCYRSQSTGANCDLCREPVDLADKLSRSFETLSCYAAEDGGIPCVEEVVEQIITPDAVSKLSSTVPLSIAFSMKEKDSMLNNSYSVSVDSKETNCPNIGDHAD
ncbi:unnamed protein product [Calicophoron daubneyi]|uniref:Tyrosine decarboxylase n=1 Tax=Calicophoron daubneyi TaxID=300641 RepID=A0AAV2TQH9_CALDB